MEIQEKTALVTGGGSGIGRATAQRLGREGALVVVGDVNEQGGSETVRLIEEDGGKAAFVQADVTSEADVQAMLAFAVETFGGLDILHNNAGILTQAPRYPEAEAERWFRVLDINLRGVILVAQHAIAVMRERGGGAIVNTASLSGLLGWATDPVYAATKGGIVLFTASLVGLKEEANIRVNCVCPGIVATPMLQRAIDAATANRPADAPAFPIIPAEDVADAVVEFIRDDSLAGRAMRMMNGQPRQLEPALQTPG